MIFSGALDTVVKFQSLTTTVDGMGSTVEAWSNMTNVPTRAEYIPIRGTEQIETGKLESKMVFKLRIRRSDSITPAVRVVARGVTAKITGIEDAGRNGMDMVLWCEGVEV
jgi:SPP1 family predicted phage head-tail adaptor